MLDCPYNSLDWIQLLKTLLSWTHIFLHPFIQPHTTLTFLDSVVHYMPKQICCNVQYCTPLYSAPLWGKLKKSSLHRLQVAYTDGFRILLQKPRWSSASELFVNAGVDTSQALWRNLMYRFIGRLND